jgi:hypothetical protein
MMKKFLYILYVFVALLTASSCGGRKQLTAKEYMAWYQDPENGLIRTKEVNGYLIKVKYIPADYQIYKDMAGAKGSKRDSVAAYYKDNVSLLLSISPIGTKDRERNIMYDGLEKFEDYKKRVFDLNFNMEELVELKLGEGISLAPSIYNVENTYGLSKELNFNIVFSPSAAVKSFESYDKIDIVLNDYIFETGISHFVFEKKELEKLPILI